MNSFSSYLNSELNSFLYKTRSDFIKFDAFAVDSDSLTRGIISETSDGTEEPQGEVGSVHLMEPDLAEEQISKPKENTVDKMEERIRRKQVQTPEQINRQTNRKTSQFINKVRGQRSAGSGRRSALTPGWSFPPPFATL